MFKGAVFIDRDGTVNVEKNYIDDTKDLKLYEGVSDAIKCLNKKGIRVILVTNQSGVARGYFTEERVHEINEYLKELLGNDGVFLDGIYYCPHHPDFDKKCDCRKPKPGLLKRAAQDLEIDLEVSYVVGDKLLDIELAHTVNAKGLLVLTGYGLETKEKLENGSVKPHFIAKGLKEAVEWIIKDLNSAT
jgi:D-glycero-D-manno-heptose 1,7-bisphosphate phosphatase